jgi:signal transduction histidine kinase
MLTNAVSHERLTPVNSVINNAELLLVDFDEMLEVQESRKRSNSSVSPSKSLFGDLVSP